MLAKKEEIKAIYEELKGLLSQIPGVSSEKPDEVSFNVSQLDYFDKIIEKLKKVVPEEDFSRFSVNTDKSPKIGPLFRISEYRQKVGGLIMFLYGTYFKEEAEPFSGSPHTVVTQSQHQAQSLQIQILLEIQSKIDEKIPQFPEKSKERGFLEKIKSSLASVGNVTELILLLLRIGKDVGLSVDQILTILK